MSPKNKKKEKEEKMESVNVLGGVLMVGAENPKELKTLKRISAQLKRIQEGDEKGKRDLQVVLGKIAGKSSSEICKDNGISLRTFYRIMKRYAREKVFWEELNSQVPVEILLGGAQSE